MASSSGPAGISGFGSSFRGFGFSAFGKTGSTSASDVSLSPNWYAASSTWSCRVMLEPAVVCLFFAHPDSVVT